MNSLSEDKIMRTKLIILVAVFSFFLLGTGNTYASYIINSPDISVTYYLTGDDGDYLMHFLIDETLSDDAYVTAFGINVGTSGSTPYSAPEDWTVKTKNKWSSRWINLTGDELGLSGFAASVSEVPDIVTYQLITSDGTMYKGLDDQVQAPESPVPEPATMLLLGTGLFGLASFGRKLKKKK
jgi:hypothetical protein